jgi:hypothetical protein
MTHHIELRRRCEADLNGGRILSSKKEQRSETAIARYLRVHLRRAEERGRTREQIATEAGYQSARILTVFAMGEARVPLDRVPALARALQVSPVHLFRLALIQYWPTEGEAIELPDGLVSENERAILQCIRDRTDNADPELTSELRGRLEAIF